MESIGLEDEVAAELTPVQQRDGWRGRWVAIEQTLATVARVRTEELSGANINAAHAELQGLFVQVFHLKDALIADSSVKIAKSDVENAVNSTPELALVADLANLDKHAVLTRKLHSGYLPSIGKVSGFTAGSGWTLTVPVTHNGHTVDGLTVARNAVAAWASLLTAWGLL